MTQVENLSVTNSNTGNSRQFFLLLIFFQTLFIVLFGFFVKYDENWNDDELTRKRLNGIVTVNESNSINLSFSAYSWRGLYYAKI